jgi:3'(2'), 5'-bisphosphate nucleotidase
MTLLSETAYKRGSRDDDKLRVSLEDRLQALLPPNAISVRLSFQKESLPDLNSKVAAFEQMAAQRIVQEYRKGPTDQQRLATSLIHLTELAGEPVRRHYLAPNALLGKTPSAKADARIAARNILFAGLRNLNSKHPRTDLFNIGLPILTDRDEREYPDERLRKNERWWLAQPLADFDRKDVSVSLALIKNGHPVMGAVHFPIKNFSFGGIPEIRWTHARTTRHAIRSIEVQTHAQRQRIAGTGYDKRNLENFRSFGRIHQTNTRRTFISGLADGFCRVARGTADFYLQDEPVTQAAMAASHAVLNAAGGSVTLIHGGTIQYRPDYTNIDPCVAAADGRQLQLRGLRQVI